jgi:hypothetical protein
MKNPKYYGASGICHAWANLCFLDKDTDATTVMDAIDDANNGDELVKNLRNLNMVSNKWVIARETDSKVKIKNTDVYGNVTYIECEK